MLRVVVLKQKVIDDLQDSSMHTVESESPRIKPNEMLEYHEGRGHLQKGKRRTNRSPPGDNRCLIAHQNSLTVRTHGSNHVESREWYRQRAREKTE
jgi:hypothetical protein